MENISKCPISKWPFKIYKLFQIDAVTVFYPIGVAPYIEAFDRLMNGSVAEFLRNSKILDGDVKTHVSTFLHFSSCYVTLNVFLCLMA